MYRQTLFGHHNARLHTSQWDSRAEWHHLLFWRRLAEVVEKYVRKGDKLYVEGEIRTRNYTDHQGIVRYVTEVWVNNMEMLTPKGQTAAAPTTAAPASAPSTAAAGTSGTDAPSTPPRPTEAPF